MSVLSLQVCKFLLLCVCGSALRRFSMNWTKCEHGYVSGDWQISRNGSKWVCSYSGFASYEVNTHIKYCLKQPYETLAAAKAFAERWNEYISS